MFSAIFFSGLSKAFGVCCLNLVMKGMPTTERIEAFSPNWNWTLNDSNSRTNSPQQFQKALEESPSRSTLSQNTTLAFHQGAILTERIIFVDSDWGKETRRITITVLEQPVCSRPEWVEVRNQNEMPHKSNFPGHPGIHLLVPVRRFLISQIFCFTCLLLTR